MISSVRLVEPWSSTSDEIVALFLSSSRLARELSFLSGSAERHMCCPCISTFAAQSSSLLRDVLVIAEESSKHLPKVGFQVPTCLCFPLLDETLPCPERFSQSFRHLKSIVQAVSHPSCPFFFVSFGSVQERGSLGIHVFASELLKIRPEPQGEPKMPLIFVPTHFRLFGHCSFFCLFFHVQLVLALIPCVSHEKLSSRFRELKDFFCLLSFPLRISLCLCPIDFELCS